VYLFRFKTVPLKLKHFRLRVKYAVKTASIGMASCINQLAMMIVQIVLNNSLKIYGARSEFGDSIPIACAGIIMKITQIFFAVIIGLGQGTQPIESYNYGAKKYARVRKAYRLAITVGAVISVAAFAVFQIFPRQIISLFGKGSEEYYSFGVKFFRIFLMFMWLNFIQPITSTFFTSIGKPVKGAVLSLTKNIIFFIPPLLILPHFMGIYGILYTGPIADFLAAAVNIFMAAWEFKIMKKQEMQL
jgi:Na+-driven multidrug efflux pump